ncbi:MAG: TrkH family potassium uptake protein [Acidimicrobiales bacterium]
MVTRTSGFERGSRSVVATGGQQIAATVAHVSGMAGCFLAAGMLVTAVVGWAFDDAAAGALALSGLSVGAVSLVMWRGTRPAPDLRRTAAFSVAAFAWVFIFLAGSVPYVLAGTFDTFVQSLYESVSGLTTAGSSVLADVEAHGRGLLLYRQYTQWFGGGGIVLLAVAILPGFGVGGLELAGAEIAGPATDRIAHRVATTARWLWAIYVGLTVVVTIALLAAGVGLFDAVAHAMATVPTGGFSTYDDSIAHFDSVAVETVLAVGMLLGATSFAVQFRVYTRGPRRFLDSAEWRAFMVIVVTGIAVVTAILAVDGMALPSALRRATFNVASVASTTGFWSSDYTLWHPGAQLVLIVLMLVGGMTASTAGGIKVLRARVVLGHVWRDLRQARQPNGVFPVRIGQSTVPDDTVAKIGAFVTLYLLTILAGTAALSLLGEDLVTGFSAVASAIGMVGLALGDAGPRADVMVFSDASRSVLILMMFLGRMELYVALLMFVAPINAIRTGRRGSQP